MFIKKNLGKIIIILLVLLLIIHIVGDKENFSIGDIPIIGSIYHDSKISLIICIIICILSCLKIRSICNQLQMKELNLYE